jgi:1-acyl-sn-glycerol-3-phosphate acyltransferase
MIFYKYILFFINIFIVTYIIPFIACFNILNNTKKEIIQNYFNLFKSWLDISIYRVSKNKLVSRNDIIYMPNHISWTDFFIDHYVTNYSSKYISRYIIAFIFPFLYLLSLLTDSCIFFKRNSIKNINKFFKNIDRKRRSDEFNNILVYPEGTRRAHTKEPSVLKKGFIYYSYDSGLLIQFIFTLNKEKVIDEKNLSIHFNQKLFVYYSDIIDPNNLKHLTREEYYNHVQLEWNKVWYETNDIKNELDNKSTEYIKNKYPILKNYIHNNNNYIDSTFNNFRVLALTLLLVYFLFNIIPYIYSFYTGNWNIHPQILTANSTIA